MTVECVVTKTYTCGFWGARTDGGSLTWGLFTCDRDYFKLDLERRLLLRVVDSGSLSHKDFACVLALAAKIAEDYGG